MKALIVLAIFCMALGFIATIMLFAWLATKTKNNTQNTLSSPPLGGDARRKESVQAGTEGVKIQNTLFSPPLGGDVRRKESVQTGTEGVNQNQTPGQGKRPDQYQYSATVFAVALISMLLLALTARPQNTGYLIVTETINPRHIKAIKAVSYTHLRAHET